MESEEKKKFYINMKEFVLGKKEFINTIIQSTYFINLK